MAASDPSFDIPPVPSPNRPQRVLLFGATGTIGAATERALLARGHRVVSMVRRPGPEPTHPGLERRVVDLGDAAALEAALHGERFDAWVSCLASRTGVPADAWAVDHALHAQALPRVLATGVRRVVQLSALCLQRPRLAFQQAKLAYEAELRDSDADWAIVRPTAFFKSLSGQVERVRSGRPFLVFGDGRLTTCKPIADDDLAAFIVSVLERPGPVRQVLPIGGPGPALTPLDQAALLGRLLGRPVAVKRVPVRLLDAIVAALSLGARVWPPLAVKAELARIGRYYATESMLVWNGALGAPDAEATPSTGRQTLEDHYRALLEGRLRHAPAEHAVF